MIEFITCSADVMFGLMRYDLIFLIQLVEDELTGNESKPLD